jgi:hypothetical protein
MVMEEIAPWPPSLESSGLLGNDHHRTDADNTTSKALRCELQAPSVKGVESKDSAPLHLRRNR